MYIIKDMKNLVLKSRKAVCLCMESILETSIIPFVVKIDEPERVSILGLKLDNGIYSQCFCYICTTHHFPASIVGGLVYSAWGLSIL